MLVRDVNCPRNTSPSPAPPPGQGLHRLPVQVHPVLLLARFHRRWDPKELLPGVTGALQCSSLGSWGSHQLSMDVCQSCEWLLWMFTAQNTAPIGNTKSECLKSIYLEIFFSVSLLGRNISEILQRLFLQKKCSTYSPHCLQEMLFSIQELDEWNCDYILLWAFLFSWVFFSQLLTPWLIFQGKQGLKNDKCDKCFWK